MKIKRWHLNLSLFDGDGGNGGGTGDGGDGGKGNGQGDAQPFKAFTSEADFNAHVATLTGQGKADFLKTLGIEKEDDLKAILEDHKKRAEDAKTAEQKLLEREGDLKAANDSIRALNVENAFVREAYKQGVDPEKLEDALRLADLSKVEVTDGGKIKGIDAFVKALVEAKPWLMQDAKPNGHTPNKGQPGGKSGSKSMMELVNKHQRRR